MRERNAIKGRYPWDSRSEEIKIKENIFKDDPESWWARAVVMAGYDSIEAYQKDIFPKFALDPEDNMPVPVTRKWLRILGWIAGEMDRTDRRESDMEMQVLVLFGMILLDSEKHRLSWQKAADDLGVREIVDRYIMHKKEEE